MSFNREFQQLRRRPQRRLQNNNRLNDQNNSSARASRFLVHFFYVHCTTTTWNLLISRFMDDVDNDDEFSFIFLNLNKILKNSTPGKVPCFWHIERVQIDAIKFERTEIHFLPTFSLPSSSSLLKVPTVFIRLKAAVLSNFFVIRGRRLFKSNLFLERKLSERALKYTHFELTNKIINENKFPKLD